MRADLIERLAAEAGGEEYGPRTWNMTFTRDALHRFAAALQSAQAQGEGWRLVGCIDRYGKLFASAENHKASTLIELGWTAVYAPTPDTGKGDGR